MPKTKSKNKKKERQDNFGFLGDSCFSYGQILVAANPLIRHKYENDPYGIAFLGFYNIYGPHIAIIVETLPPELNFSDLSENHQLHLLTVNRGILADEVLKILKYYGY